MECAELVQFMLLWGSGDIISAFLEEFRTFSEDFG